MAEPGVSGDAAHHSSAPSLRVAQEQHPDRNTCTGGVASRACESRGGVSGSGPTGRGTSC